MGIEKKNLYSAVKKKTHLDGMTLPRGSLQNHLLKGSILFFLEPYSQNVFSRHF